MTTIRQCGKLARERLDQGAEEAFGRLARLESIEEFEAERKRLNDIYVKAHHTVCEDGRRSKSH